MQHKTVTNILSCGECVYLRHWKHLCSWGRIFLGNLYSIKNTRKEITMKQMFDISEHLISEQSVEIYGVNTINWGDSARKHLSLIGNEDVVSLSRAKFLLIFRFCVMPWKDEREPTIKYCLGGHVDVVQKFHHNTELWTQFMVSQLNSSGILSQDSPHCSSATKSKSSWQR